MKTIWKFPFEVTDLVELRMPANSTLLHIDVQNDQPCVWAAVNPDEPMVLRNLRIFRTRQNTLGLDFDPTKHVATFLIGENVWHVFDEGDQR